MNLSLRAKFLILSGAMQALVACALVGNSVRLLDGAIGAPGAGALAAARAQLLEQGALIGLAVFGLGLLVLALFSAGVGRRLKALHARSRRLALGEFDDHAPHDSGDELQAFSRTLNTMSVALRERIALLDLAEQRLRESDARFQILFDTAPVSLTVTKRSGEVIAVNQALTRVFGHAQDEVLGKLPSEIGFWADPGEKDRVWQIYRRDGVVKGEIAQVQLRSGRRGDVAIWSSTLTLDGCPAIIWALLDLTEEFDAKRALRELNASLESRVRLRSAELERANADLSHALETLQRTQHDLISSEKMASLGSLVAGVAHELNTPIGNSLLAATALADRVGEFRRQLDAGALKRSMLTGHLDDSAHACDLISGSLHRAANLIASFKQVAVDQTSDERREFDLRHVLEDTLATFAPRLRRANCRSQVEVDGELRLESYPGSLCQVINNLINNALVHAFEQRSSGAISISARPAGAGEVAVVFADDGAGMADDVLRRVFDPFFTTKLGRGGSGLGMNIVYNIVTGVLGGRIEIATGVGRGTTVSISIPTVAPLRENARRAAADALFAG